jgi:hypothetical protein
MPSSNTSGYKGVKFVEARSHLETPYRVNIRVDGKLIDLGHTRTAIDGAVVYNQAARKYFGEFARLNKIDPEEEKKILVDLATYKDKKLNKTLYSNSETRYKGVTPHKDEFQVNIHVNGKQVYVGKTATAREGAIMYNEASIKYFGKDAYQNPL